jgi:ankyrin repeat protein
MKKNITKYSTTELHQAVQSGDYNNFVELLANGSTLPTAIDKKGNKPIYYACIRGYEKIAKILIDCTQLTILEEKILINNLLALSEKSESHKKYFIF